MRTAIVSDLHLGAVSGEDVLRHRAVRRTLLEEIETADRVVLLGDVVELRDLPLGTAMAAARPFFEELGEALGEREVILVPGNHDHRFAEPLLDRLSLAGETTIGLENRYPPFPGPTAEIDRWLGDARLELAYPGVWLRDDAYATHGHYMDCHLSLPRAECVAVAAVMRAAGPLPDPATVRDYERILRPLYGLAFGLAQARVGRLPGRGSRPSEAVWMLLGASQNGARPGRRIARSAVRAGTPAAIWGLNQALGSRFKPDLSLGAIMRSGVVAAAETANRLRIEASHLITGHTHHAGPAEGEEPWALQGGGRLHNTGNWVFSTALHHPGAPPGPYWPGTVTWLEGSAEPRRVRLLSDRPAEELLGRESAG